jgi:hypothetical protein
MDHRGAAFCCGNAGRFFVAFDCLCAGFFSASSGDGGGGGTGGATSSGDGCLAAGSPRANGESDGSLKMNDFELDMITFRSEVVSTGVAVCPSDEFTLELADGNLAFGSFTTFGPLSLGTTTAADFEPGKIVRGESTFVAGAAFGFELPGSRPPART